MIIPSFKPSVSYRELNIMLAGVLSGKAFAGGDEISVFEDNFARYLGVKYAVSAPSGRWGLYYVLKNLNLKDGDEVILPAFTYFAVPAVIVKLGLKPVFVDISPVNFEMDVEDIKKSITGRTRVIIPTHLCGFACAMDKILDIAGKYNIAVIEDCAQSLGAEYKNKKTGSFGKAAYFTFGVTKNFTTLGGGMIATNDKELAENIQGSVKSMRSPGAVTCFFKLLEGYIMKLATSAILFPGVYCIMRMFSFFGIDIIGCIFNEKSSAIGDPPLTGRLNNVQAELGLAQLSDLDRKNGIRMRIGSGLYDKLRGSENIQVPLPEVNAKNIFSTCPVLVKDKKNVRKILLKKGIDVSAGYMRDCSRLEAFKEFKKHCPNASRAEERALYLPLYPEMAFGRERYMEGVIKKVCGSSLLIALVLFSVISYYSTSAVYCEEPENIIYIPKDFPSIQRGIDEAKDGDLLLVSPGKYTEAINFRGKMITLKSQAGPDMTIIDGNKNGPVVIFNSGESNKSVLEGFTIQNGLAEQGAVRGGGGILCHNSGPLIKNNIIKNNKAENGGGILCIDCSDKKPVIISNLIRDNEAVKGGGIRCSDSSPVIANNIIIKNIAKRLGGGIYWRASSSPCIINNTVIRNAAGEYGGGVFGSNSIALEGPVVLSNSILWENRAPLGTQVALNLSGTKAVIASSAVQYGENGVFLMTGGISLNYFSDNISADPKIKDIDGASLAGDSPCIDSGNNEYALSAGIIVDFNGNERISDGNGDGKSTVDMGSCEFGALKYQDDAE